MSLNSIDNDNISIGSWTWVYIVTFCFIGGPLLIITGIVEAGQIYGLYHQRFNGTTPDSVSISGLTICVASLLACLYRIKVGIQLIRSRDETLPQSAISMTWWTGPVLGLVSLVTPILVFPWLSWSALATPAALLSVILSLAFAYIWSEYFKKSSRVTRAYIEKSPFPQSSGFWGRVRKLLWNPPS